MNHNQVGNNSRQNERGFTLTELFVVIAVVAMLAALLVPALAQAKRNAQRAGCVNNQKQIFLAFKVWENNHENKYPTAVRTADGGAAENIVDANFVQHINDGWIMAYGPTNVFIVMSNELGNLNVVYCPSDITRTVATNWAKLDNNGLSYFIEGDTSDKNPKMILIGDRNLGNNLGNALVPPVVGDMTRSGVYPAQTIFPANATKAISSAAQVGATTKVLPWAWTENDLHKAAGNLGIADGSVAQTALPDFVTYISDTKATAPQNGKLIFNFP
jgi:prepilin-type N-terminal cleavage/methylation domain-containing protein